MTAGLTLTAPGCIVSGDDDDDGISDGGDGGDGGGECGESFAGILYTPTWECPPDAETITFTATPAGSSTSLTPDTFDCDEPQPPDICYDPGTYDIEVLPEGAIGEFAPQFDEITGGDGDDITADFPFSQDGGFLAVDWTIDGEDPLDVCADIGATTFAVDATLQDDPSLELAAEVPCEDAFAIVPENLDGWPVGEYVVDVLLLDDLGDPISDPADTPDIFIDFPGHLSSDIGSVDFVTF